MCIRDRKLFRELGRLALISGTISILGAFVFLHFFGLIGALIAQNIFYIVALSLFVFKTKFIFSNFNQTSDDIDVLTHEAGHAFQNMNLMSTACQLGSLNIGGFFDNDICKILGIDSEDEINILEERGYIIEKG